MIAGEQFQALADICLTADVNQNIQRQKITGNLQHINNVSTTDIKKYKKIFVYTHDAGIFIDKYFEHLNNDTIIITHNSDDHITESCKDLLDSPKIKKWYCQNRQFEHEKLITIPIGLANSQWPHGNQKMIEEVRNENNKKDILVYKNFDVSTSPIWRLPCHELTKMNGIPMYPNKSNEDYWRMLSRSAFVISPRGNGVDCHRIWECLYLKTVPVLFDEVNFSQFKHLPVLNVPNSNWENITIDFLRDKYSEFKNRFENPIPELTIEYWKERINKGE